MRFKTAKMCNMGERKAAAIRFGKFYFVGAKTYLECMCLVNSFRLALKSLPDPLNSFGAHVFEEFSKSVIAIMFPYWVKNDRLKNNK